MKSYRIERWVNGRWAHIGVILGEKAAAAAVAGLDAGLDYQHRFVL